MGAFFVYTPNKYIITINLGIIKKMAKIIKGTLNVGKTAYSNGNAVVTTFNGSERDSTTSGFSVDTYTTNQLLDIISVFPVSNFIPNAGLITYSSYNITFNSTNQALLSGNYLLLPACTIDLRTIKVNPENSLFHVYITMVQGDPKYLITDTVMGESSTSAYNIFWIGTITTGSSSITATNINSRTRLDTFSPSVTAAGSSFPVSSGVPSQTGTINW